MFECFPPPGISFSREQRPCENHTRCRFRTFSGRGGRAGATGEPAAPQQESAAPRGLRAEDNMGAHRGQPYPSVARPSEEAKESPRTPET